MAALTIGTTTASASALVEVEQLRVRYGTQAEAVKGVSFQLRRGEKLGIVGESGSGKTQTVRAIAGILPGHARVEATRLVYNGHDLQAMHPARRHRLRGRCISMVMQDPHYSLNPVMRIGRQIDEVFLAHRGCDRREARERSLAALAALKIDDPQRVYHAYPQEISGGMGQRVMMAMMLAPEPDLLIADEPTSALDASVAESVLRELRQQIEQRGMSMILISHDLELVASFCDRIVVMYAGRIVEECLPRQLHEARHPYTQGLLTCVPRLGSHGQRLPTLVRRQEWLS